METAQYSKTQKAKSCQTCVRSRKTQALFPVKTTYPCETPNLYNSPAYQTGSDAGNILVNILKGYFGYSK